MEMKTCCFHSPLLRPWYGTVCFSGRKREQLGAPGTHFMLLCCLLVGMRRERPTHKEKRSNREKRAKAMEVKAPPLSTEIRPIKGKSQLASRKWMR